MFVATPYMIIFCLKRRRGKKRFGNDASSSHDRFAGRDEARYGGDERNDEFGCYIYETNLQDLAELWNASLVEEHMVAVDMQLSMLSETLSRKRGMEIKSYDLLEPKDKHDLCNVA